MKKLLFLPVFLFIFLASSGQDMVSMSYNTTASGRNISLCYTKNIKSKNEIGGGLRINISQIKQPDDQGNLFYKRLFATEFYHYFGIQLYYHRTFFDNWKCVKPFFFYDLQMTYSTTRTGFYYPYAYDPNNGDILYKYALEYFGPFYWLEQAIGVGFKANLFKSFYLFQKIGPSIMFILGEEETIPETYDKFEWEFGYLFTVGLAYKIN